MVRNPRSTRPWQHVLEPLGGYLALAAQMKMAKDAGDSARMAALCSGFNFGPGLDSNRSVGELVQEILRHWPGTWQDASSATQPHEAGLLNLALDKAHHVLGWSPVWNFAQCVANTVAWYRTVSRSAQSATSITKAQLEAYQERMFSTNKGLS